MRLLTFRQTILLIFLVLLLETLSSSLSVGNGIVEKQDPLSRFVRFVKNKLSRVVGKKEKQSRPSAVVSLQDMQSARGGTVVPIIDISKLFSNSLEDRLVVSRQIGEACERIGFFVIVNHGVDKAILDHAWSATREFFDRPLEEKLQHIRPQHVYPFGYTKFKGEVLRAGKEVETSTGGDRQGADSAEAAAAAADLKEMFSLGPSAEAAGFPTRIFPTEPQDFAQAWTIYYDTMASLASVILKAFALALDLPEGELFFEQFIDHHASALRALNYPHLEGYVPIPGQLRASAHTDYGTITILRSDAPGLQVSKDTHPPVWCDVPFVEDGLIVNLGDLMKRWTNDRWLSTLHRVVNPDHNETCWSNRSESTRRQSMAFFHNLNKDAIVKVLNAHNPKYEPIVAGEFLMQKHLAATAALQKDEEEQLTSK